jgi:hypothetical protein
MNERNQELIVDLLGGRLSPEEELTALARIDSDPDLRAEYEAQMSAMTLLSASETPMMTADERASLHAALRLQLHLDDATVRVVAAPSRWQRWWAPLGGLAVAAVIVGAIVVLPDVLSDGDSIGDFETASAELTTTVPSASLAEDLSGGVEDENTGDETAGAAAPEASGSTSDGESSPDTEVQSAEAYDAAAAPPDALPYLTDVDLSLLESDLASNPEVLRSDPSPSSAKSADVDTDRVSACLDSLRADNPSSEIFPIALTSYEGTESIVVSVSPSAGENSLAVYSVVLCRELASTQG